MKLTLIPLHLLENFKGWYDLSRLLFPSGESFNIFFLPLLTKLLPIEIHWNLIVVSIFPFADFIAIWLNTAITLYAITTYQNAYSIASKSCIAKTSKP